MSDNIIAPFEPEDIEDVRIIIKAKGKNYGIAPDTNICSREEARELRIKMLQFILTGHNVIDKPLEELHTNENKEEHEQV